MNLKKQNGFAMMEVLVTAIIIAIGVSGMGVLLLRAIQGTQDTSQQSQALWIIQDYVGRIRANSEAARAGDYAIDANNLPNCANQYGGTICGEYTDANDNEVAANICSAADMAAFDIYVTMCSLTPITNDELNGNAPRLFDSAADFVLNPTITSTCSVTDNARVSSYSGQPDCVQYDIQFQWSTKTQQGAVDPNDRDFINDYSLVVELN